MSDGAIRVLVVGETLPDREDLANAVEGGKGLAVAASVGTGSAAIASIRRLRPGVALVGCGTGRFAIETAAAIMAAAPVPVVLVGRDPERRPDLAAAGNAVGALGVVDWPSGPEEASALRDKLRVMAGVGVVRRWKDAAGKVRAAWPPAAASRPPPSPSGAWSLVAIAGSTGAPGVLAEILGGVTSDFPAPVLIVQHLTEGFTDSFARWLGSKLALPVVVATADTVAAPGHAYVAPDHHHLGINVWRRLVLSDDPPIEGFRPSGSYLFSSAARAFGDRTLGIILTGMGEDGATGLLDLRNAGGLTISQDQQSSVVYGMPRQAAAIGAVRQQLPPAGIARLLAGGGNTQKDARHAG